MTVCRQVVSVIRPERPSILTQAPTWTGPSILMARRDRTFPNVSSLAKPRTRQNLIEKRA